MVHAVWVINGPMELEHSSTTDWTNEQVTQENGECAGPSAQDGSARIVSRAQYVSHLYRLQGGRAEIFWLGPWSASPCQQHP